jgi:NAD(P)-dependent dehydrogenase (short-subunit alcohol dehydrogenase family)
MSLAANQVVLLFGGTGVVGSATLKYLLEKDVRVVVSSRNQNNIDALKEEHASKSDLIHGIVVDAGDREGQLVLKDYIIKTFGEDSLDHVISIHGDTRMTKDKNPISEVSHEELESMINGKLYAQHEAIRIFYPILKKSKSESPSFTIVTGAAGSFVPALEWSLITISNAALFGIALTLMAEAETRNDKVRVNEYRIANIIVKDKNPSFGLNNLICGEALVAIVNSKQRKQVFSPKTQENFEKLTKLE